jgi:hypothetical protein
MAQPIYKEVSDIKARVKTDWSHGRHKFQPGDNAEVSGRVIPREWVSTTGEIRQGTGYVSKVKQKRVGRVGEVVAVSCTPSGKVRGDAEHGYCHRMYTKYYIQFRDGVIMGYDSHHLTKAFTHGR